MDRFEQQDELDRLVACQQPLLIGVRHHSAALAKTVPALLDKFQPDRVLIELPEEFTPWIPWLGHEGLVAPVALAGNSEGLDDLCFYPFAGVSPELAAIRWAAAHQVPVELCDLPVAQRLGCEYRDCPDPRTPTGLLAQIFRRTHTRDVGALWERLVETPACDADAESIRRAGLLFGWAVRSNDAQASRYDRLREGHMRATIARGKAAAVIGSYHAAALLPDPLLWEPVDAPVEPAARPVTTALIPYSFEQLDERSSYPAGILDPMWHQRTYLATNVDAVHALAADFVVAVCRELRSAGHPAGAADGKEVVRVARDLARLRGFAAPGRGELLEAVQTCLTRGELMGVGRAVARALESVLVGNQSGQLADATPRSGLGPHVEQLLDELSLPRTLGSEKRMRLDPLRSRLDRARVVMFQRLAALGIPYAKRADSGQSQLGENLTEVWDVSWQHATLAMLELSAARGATLLQAVAGLVVQRDQEPEPQEPERTLATLELAARCGLLEATRRGLQQLMGPYVLTARLGELTAAMQIVEAIRLGHVPALPLAEEECWEGHVQRFEMPAGVHTAPLLQAAIARLDGLAGSEDVLDVAAILDLVTWFQQQGHDPQSLEAGRLVWSLRQMEQRGSALMQGAATAALLLLGIHESELFAERMGAWIDAATGPESRTQLRERLQGAVLVAAARLAGDAGCLTGLTQRLNQLEDDDFMVRLPASGGAPTPAGRLTEPTAGSECHSGGEHRSGTLLAVVCRRRSWPPGRAGVAARSGTVERIAASVRSSQ